MPTRTRHRFDGDDSPFDETVARSDAELMNRLEKQFRRLQMKAQEIGVDSVVVLHATDPLNGYSYRRANRVGNHYANYGAMAIATELLKAQLANDQD